MGTDESLAVSTMSRPTQGPSSSLEEFPQKIGVPLQEPKNKQPLNHLPQEPPKSWGKSWLFIGVGPLSMKRDACEAVCATPVDVSMSVFAEVWAHLWLSNRLPVPAWSE